MSADAVTAIIQGNLDSMKEAGTADLDPGEQTVTETAPASEAAPVETPPVDAAPPAAPPVDPAKPTAEEDEETALKALEAELTAKTPGLAKGKISASRHQAVLTRRQRAHDEALKKIQDELNGYGTDEAKHTRTVGEMAQAEPERFFKDVMLKDPVYQSIIAAYVEAQKTSAAAAPPAPLMEEKAPEPDIVNPDGTLGYSPKALEQAIQFHARQQQKSLSEEIAALKKQLDPITSDRQARQQFDQARDRQVKAWEHAKANWDGFAEHEQEIASVLTTKGNEKMTLDEAHRQVMKAKKPDLAALQKQWEADYVKKLNQAPAGKPPVRVPTNGQVAQVADTTTPRSSEDIIRAELRKLGQSPSA